MTDEFDPHISINKVKAASDHSGYVIKEYSDFGGYQNVTSPIKAMDMGGLSSDTKRSFTFEEDEPPIMLIEKPFSVDEARKWTAVKDLIEGDFNKTVEFSKLINLKPALCKEFSKASYFPSIVFSSSPFKARVAVQLDKEGSKKAGRRKYHVKKYESLDRDNFETFIQNIYAYSEGMVLVPDIMIREVQKVPHRVAKGTWTCTVEEYIENVSGFCEIMRKKNNKPIFMPIQPTFTSKAIDQIIEHYRKSGFSNVWVDFCGGEVYHGRLAGLRMILDRLNKAFGPTGYVVYYSHMKKEIPTQADFTESTAPASDMLSQFVDADIIGANRNRRGGGDDNDQDDQMKKHGITDRTEWLRLRALRRSRVFDPDSYYYCFPTKHPLLEDLNTAEEELTDPAYVKAIDSRIKFDEVENVKRVCQDQMKVKPYTKKKKMFEDKKDVYKEIFEHTVQQSLF